MTGLSLGGFTAAMLASVEDRLAFAIPNVPVVSLADLVLEWQPIGVLLRGALSTMGMELSDARRLVAASCPLTYPPVLPPERLMIVAGVGDRLAPPKHSRLLWDHWGRCRIHWFPAVASFTSIGARISRSGAFHGRARLFARGRASSGGKAVDFSPAPSNLARNLSNEGIHGARHSPSRRKGDIVVLVFFWINILFITYIVDVEQIVLPDISGDWEYPLWPPAFCVDIIHWYGRNFDPVLIARPAWWRMTIWIDALFFGPFYITAIYAWTKGKNGSVFRASSGPR